MFDVGYVYNDVFISCFMFLLANGVCNKRHSFSSRGKYLAARYCVTFHLVLLEAQMLPSDSSFL
jgi:hypothetical protein